MAVYEHSAKKASGAAISKNLSIRRGVCMHHTLCNGVSWIPVIVTDIKNYHKIFVLFCSFLSGFANCILLC